MDILDGWMEMLVGLNAAYLLKYVHSRFCIDLICVERQWRCGILCFMFGRYVGADKAFAWTMPSSIGTSHITCFKAPVNTAARKADNGSTNPKLIRYAEVRAALMITLA
ncbi:hypothetical protein TWF217_011482 [Orbilia oligospora]|nr:hypothetical protein TWF217_011482 [Orbilia oligospora]KAF3257988.1 hypothetical protein TWF128_004887 [Orbilia oligospora]KAF3286361.1 hypothetical protein TWF132_008932 [Orbilia oligospora]